MTRSLCAFSVPLRPRPQVRQIANAYALRVPASAATHAAKTAPPLPDDHAAAFETAAAELAVMIESLPIGQRMSAFIDDDMLAASLARLGEQLGVV